MLAWFVVAAAMLPHASILICTSLQEIVMRETVALCALRLCFQYLLWVYSTS